MVKISVAKRSLLLVMMRRTRIINTGGKNNAGAGTNADRVSNVCTTPWSPALADVPTWLFNLNQLSKLVFFF
jgi:dihydroxyacetone kinase DhaKLM complex PTS-EIIA-like component DhaM